MLKPQRILVSLFHDVGWGRDFVRGLGETGRQASPPWLLQLRSPVESLAGVWQEREWDGAVIQVIDEAGEHACRTAPCPVVLVDPRPDLLPELPRLNFNHETVGTLASSHLRETGRKHFAFVGFDGAKISERREAAFLEHMRQAGWKPDVLRVPVALRRPRSRLALESLPDIRRFVLSLPHPLAVFTGNDEVARALLEECIAVGLKVPEDVAILGADDDDLLCLTCSPSLSSVRLPFEQAGREGAGLLLELMSGRKVENTVREIGPSGVETRESSRVVPGENRLVEAAMRSLHQRYSENIGMEDIAKEAGVSLSTLERHFKNCLGRTPLEELRRLRVQRAKAMLEETTIPAGQIARACGFGSAIRFSIVFREMAGCSPLAFRRASRERRR